jgi:HPt (histidine-containing phosphotransfer) domain-containing protein
MKTLQQMQQDGIDVEGAMERFLNNEDMFRRFLRRLPEENSYREFMTALREEDVAQAFVCGHRLKGLLGNLSLVDTYNVLYDIVEVLRGGNLPEPQLVERFVGQYEKTLAYVATV